MADQPTREDPVAEVAEHRAKNDEEHLTLAFDTGITDRLVVRFDFPGGSRLLTISAR